MPTKDEDLAIVSLLTSHIADVLPYFRLPYFLDLFPTRRKAVEWAVAFADTNQTTPKLALLKKQFPAVNTLLQAEPLPYCFSQLKDQYIDTIAANTGQKMSEALEQKNNQDLIKHAQALTDLVSIADKPLGATADDSDTFVEQLGASLDKDAALALKCTPTDFKPLDDEDGGGLRPGHLYVLASLVNLGKTYVSLKMADNNRKHGARVLYTSTEMPREDLLKRALCVRYGLNANEFIKRVQPQASIDAGVSKLDWYKGMLQKVQTLVDADKCTGKLFVRGNDEGVLQPRQIRADCKELSIDVVYIDAAQDIRDDKLTKERTPCLYNALAELNSLANALHVALVFTVQLDSEVEKKGLSQGNLNRIQWAQAFAQKAHIVVSMLGQRDAAFRDMSIEKGRDGGAGRKFWLSYVFPNVTIEATCKPPGTLADLDPSASPAETLAELAAALSATDDPAPSSSPVSLPPPVKRLASPPARIAPGDAQNAPRLPSSPYQTRRDQKAKGKPPFRKKP